MNSVGFYRDNNGTLSVQNINVNDLAKKYGLKNSEEMVVQTMLGSLLLLLKTQDNPKSLRAGVTSKGGTTEAALTEFTKNSNL